MKLYSFNWLLLACILLLSSQASSQLLLIQDLDLVADGTGGMDGSLNFGDNFGTSMAHLGDLDGDGLQEIAVGAPSSTNGKVYILTLLANGRVSNPRIISDGINGFSGNTVLTKFGLEIAELGDIDGDGIGDLAVSAPNDFSPATTSGVIYILMLNSDGSVKTQYTIDENDPAVGSAFAGQIGKALCNAGDRNGDGIDDLAMIGNSGGLTDWYILYMTSSGAPSGHVKFDTDTGSPLDGLSGSFGESITLIGDVDGNGTEDFAIGAPLDNEGSGSGTGAVYIIFMNNDAISSYQKISKTQGGFYFLLETADVFGRGLHGPGDLTGDGIPDLLVGAPGDDDCVTGSTPFTSKGAVYLIWLNADGTVFLITKYSDTAGNLAGPLDLGGSFGKSIATPGDINGDGEPELLVGAYTYEVSGSGNYGAVYSMSLSTSGCIAPYNLSTTSITSNGATLNWAPQTGFAAGYRLEGRPQGSSNWKRVQVPGLSTLSYSVNVLNSNTDYEWRITPYCPSAGGFGNTSDIEQFTTSALRQIAPTVEASIYPNLASSSFQLQSDLSGLIEIFDMNGRLVHQQQVEIGTTTFDVSLYQNGVYLVQLNGRLIDKVVIGRE